MCKGPEKSLRSPHFFGLRAGNSQRDETKCVESSKLRAAQAGDFYASDGKLFMIQSYGECPTPAPAPAPTARPTPAPTPVPTAGPTKIPPTSPSSNPTYSCGSALPVIQNDPIANMTIPVSFGGIDNPEWEGFKLDEVLDSYIIHMRFRLSPERDGFEGTLIHFQEDAGFHLDARQRKWRDSLELQGLDLCLFDCNAFDIRTECWVDLKITLAITGEMKFLISDGINAAHSSVVLDPSTIYKYRLLAMAGSMTIVCCVAMLVLVTRTGKSSLSGFTRALRRI